MNFKYLSTNEDFFTVNIFNYVLIKRLSIVIKGIAKRIVHNLDRLWISLLVKT